MTTRPSYINVPSRSFDISTARTPSPGDGPTSPRSGQVPPALSPLDAFALQGRILAQKLEQARINGGILSRLDHSTVSEVFTRPRPGYEEQNILLSPLEDGDGDHNTRRDKEESTERKVREQTSKHQSYYPVISAFEDLESSLRGGSLYEPSVVSESTPAATPTAAKDYFSTWKTASPIESQDGYRIKESRRVTPESGNMPALIVGPSGRVPSPRFRHHRHRSSIRMVQPEDSNESPSVITPDSMFCNGEHNNSDVTNTSLSRSPNTCAFLAPPRSPSVSSTYTTSRTSSINFSRPLSRTRQASYDRRPSSESSTMPMTATVSDIPLNAATPSPRLAPAQCPIDVSPMMPSDFPAPHPAPAYVHSKYSIPRQRNISNVSRVLPDSKLHKFEWQEPENAGLGLVSLDDRKTRNNATNSLLHSAQPLRRSSADDRPPLIDRLSHKSNTSLPTLSSSLSTPPPNHGLNFNLNISTPPSLRIPALSSSPNASIPMSPEDHLTTGISLHESGALQKSTYHLRIAARAGLPTAMLLYALACRHGWGMRANQAEGVAWLRKAVDGAGEEIAIGNASETFAGLVISTPEPRTVSKKATRLRSPLRLASQLSFPATSLSKRHTASLALSIYELGVSYMNGWGVTRDRSLALQCFKVAGAWGDTDALAEAGECYAKGIGCKKDLRRAAELLRRAEEMGVGGVGWSWIYKEKYMPASKPTDISVNVPAAISRAGVGGDIVKRDIEKSTSESNAKPDTRFRARSIFGGGAK